MNTEVLTTGGLAKASGIGVETVRYYERIGILSEPERTPGGHRQYGRADLRRVRFVRAAQELGFTLTEIRELLELRVEAGKSCRPVAAKADAVILRIDRKIDELKAMRRALGDLRDCCDRQTPTGDCPILDAIEGDTRETDD
jgi:MerR family mercuric resistance operon transcriptional regulator